jgi:hypothetical protein
MSDELYYDTESILFEVKTMLLDPDIGINSQIATINDEKSAIDTGNYGSIVVIPEIDDNAIYMLTVDQRMEEYDYFIGLTIESEEVDVAGGTRLKIGVNAYVLNTYDWLVDVRALRYRRALQDVFDNHRLFGGLIQSREVGLKTVDALLGQEMKPYRKVGIALDLFYQKY